MRIALGTAAILALFVFAYIGWVRLSSEAPVGPQLGEIREQLGNRKWFDPVVRAQVGLFNPTQLREIGATEASALEALG